MLTSKRCISLVWLCLVLQMGLFASLSGAASRVTFDGQIHNNSLAISPDETIAVVSYSERPELLVYNLQTGRVQAVLDGFLTPRNIVFAPSGNVFYVSDSSLGVVAKIDRTSFKTLAQLPVGPGVFGTTISPNGKTLYVTNQAANTVTVYDLESDRAKAVITGFAQPRQGIRLNPDGTKLFATNFLSDRVAIVDTKTNTIEGEIEGFNQIRAISITADGKTLFAANSGANTIAVVDVARRAIVKTIPVGNNPYGAALTPDERFLYTGNLKDNTLSVIALPSLEVVATVIGLKEPRQAIVFTEDSQTAFVLNEDLSVAKVDVKANQVLSNIGPK